MQSELVAESGWMRCVSVGECIVLPSYLICSRRLFLCSFFLLGGRFWLRLEVSMLPPLSSLKVVTGIRFWLDQSSDNTRVLVNLS